jgi:uncharacterized RDD family membrane protein YckC
MRCPKCQYLGFEPSPRCKNCGYDFSFGSDDLPSLTIVPEPDPHDALADFDLQIFDEAAPRSKSSAMSSGFDLDELLAHGRSEPALEMEFKSSSSSTASAVATPPAEDVMKIVEAEVVAKAPEPITVPVPVPEVIAARVAVSRPIVAAEMVTPIAAAPPVARASVVRAAAPPAAPVTTELPLFMQVMSESTTPKPVVDVRASAPLTIEAAPDAVPVPAAMAPAARVVEEVDDRPLVQVPTVPRPPLAVRRTTPDPARLRAKYARANVKPEGAALADSDLLRGIDEPAVTVAANAAPANRLSAEPTPESLPAGWLQGVSVAKRVSAAAVDGLLLGSLNAAIVWFTLSVLGMGPSQAHLLPLVPFALFFLLVDGGYLVLFTAACGQTIGKMAAGIRVVGTTTGAVINDRISLGQAVARSLGTIASFVPLGAGFWMSLVGDGRAFHDRIAHTRVVRA